jgi:RNA polymerase sigma factor (sigma-70 family)
MSFPVGPVPATSDEVTVVGEVAPSFEAFYESTHARLYAALCLVTGNRAEAEELSQDAFLRLWERWDRVAGMDDPVSYLYRTAMNLFRKRYRRAVLALRNTASVELRGMGSHRRRTARRSRALSRSSPRVSGRRWSSPS